MIFCHEQIIPKNFYLPYPLPKKANYFDYSQLLGMLEAETETNEEEIADEAYHDDKRSRVKDYKMPRRKTTRRRRIPSKIMDYYR